MSGHSPCYHAHVTLSFKNFDASMRGRLQAGRACQHGVRRPVRTSLYRRLQFKAVAKDFTADSCLAADLRKSLLCRKTSDAYLQQSVEEAPKNVRSTCDTNMDDMHLGGRSAECPGLVCAPAPKPLIQTSVNEVLHVLPEFEVWRLSKEKVHLLFPDCACRLAGNCSSALTASSDIMHGDHHVWLLSAGEHWKTPIM